MAVNSCKYGRQIRQNNSADAHILKISATICAVDLRETPLQGPGNAYQTKKRTYNVAYLQFMCNQPVGSACTDKTADEARCVTAVSER